MYICHLIALGYSFSHTSFISAVEASKASSTPGLAVDTGEDHDRLGQSKGRARHTLTSKDTFQSRDSRGGVVFQGPGPSTRPIWGRKELVKGGSHLSGWSTEGLREGVRG